MVSTAYRLTPLWLLIHPSNLLSQRAGLVKEAHDYHLLTLFSSDAVILVEKPGNKEESFALTGVCICNVLCKEVVHLQGL